MSGQRVFTTSGVADDRADAVAEEQEVAVGGHRVTEVEDGGDLGCWGRGLSATAIGVHWLCLETPVEIHPAPVPGSPGGVRERQWGRAEPPMATTDAHATAMATEEQGGARPRLTFFPPPQSRQLSGPRCGVGGIPTPSWGCGTLTMAGRPLTAGWGWGTRHAILGLGDILHGLGLWEQVGGGGLGTPLHPAVCDTKPPLTRSSSADLDLDLDSHVPDSSLPNTASRAGRHALLLLEKKVKVSAPLLTPPALPPGMGFTAPSGTRGGFVLPLAAGGCVLEKEREIPLL